MPDRSDDLRPAASCRTCDSTELRPLIVLERNGEPPWIQPHQGMVYHHVVLFLCTACFSAQLEKWDHDCFVMDPGEPWDLYDWYVVDAADALRLRVLLGACPAPLRPECECAAHTTLKAASKDLPRSTWSGFAWTGYGDGTQVRRDGCGGRKRAAAACRGIAPRAGPGPPEHRGGRKWRPLGVTLPRKRTRSRKDGGARQLRALHWTLPSGSSATLGFSYLCSPRKIERPSARMEE